MSTLGELERNESLLTRADSAEAAAPATGANGVLRFITAGSVDDGKSTLIGRLLHDTRTILDDQLAAVERASKKRGQEELDLSLLTDGLEAEREQGITIDVAYRYFATPRRKFIIADTPGHEQYTRNMVTAASTADAAIILVDARKGILAQTRRHLYIAHLLGIRRILVAINKMDLVGYEYEVFKGWRDELTQFAAPLAFPTLQFIPLSALRGDMVVDRGAGIDWYDGPTLLEALEEVQAEDPAISHPLRFPVQLVARPESASASRRYLGQIASGMLFPGTPVTVLPSGQQTTVREIRTLDGELSAAAAGEAVSLVLADEIDISRGDMLADPARLPRVSRKIDARVCWLGSEPLQLSRRYLVKHTTRTVRARVSALHEQVNIQTLERQAGADSLAMNEIGRIRLELQQPVICDAYDQDRNTGSFILIDELTNQTVAAGMIESENPNP
jgi:sulfate adenylyltransferase subunit 1